MFDVKTTCKATGTRVAIDGESQLTFTLRHNEGSPMATQVKLQSEKYLKYSAESTQIRRLKNRIAVRALLALFVGIALIPGAIYVGEHIHVWTPLVDQWIAEASGGKYQLPRVELPAFANSLFNWS